jgi:hypothetical protein
VLYAAKHAPRELWIGGSAIRAIVGQRIFPGLIDRYLARTGYKSQQTNEAIAPDRKDNLFEPVAGDRGAHGDFDRRSRRHSAELWARRHRKLLAATTLVGCAGFAAGIGRTKASFKAVTLVFQRS